MNNFSRSVLSVSAFITVVGYPASELKSEEVIELDAVIVTASPFAVEKEDLVVPASRLAGSDLDRAGSSSLGATIDGQPGVHSSSFGAGAGRPIIRGFDGDRVRILNNGTSNFDVSETSPDHGVSVEPLFADGIEIVRGPASLLYGSAAIGGVVNVIGKEIPRERALRPLSGESRVDYGSAADLKSIGISLQGGEGDYAWSAGYLKRKTGNYEIPGFAESLYQMQAEEEEEEEHEHEDHEEDEHEEDGHEEEEVFGVLENSFVETETGYLGMTRFGENGLLGFSVSQYETLYGVPGHAHHEEHEEEEDHHEEEGHEEGEEHEDSVTIDLNQTRFAGRALLLEPNNFFESLELQFGYGSYEHVELEGDEVGTRFERDGYELRATAVHNHLGDATGAWGLQVSGESFSAIGEEALVPSNESRDLAVFAVERLNTEWGAWEFGGRLESVSVDPDDSNFAKRSFTTANGSVGFVRAFAEGSVLAANLAYAERAPNANELYAFGPHAGTRTFEIGGSSLGKESSMNIDLSLRRAVGKVTGEFTVFHSDFSDYVYLQFLDDTDVNEMYGELDTEGFGVFRSVAADASFYGFELDLRFHIVDELESQHHFDLLIDQTRATNNSFDSNLPRIPTRRIGGRWESVTGKWQWGVEGRYHYAASHLAPNEFPTDSYFVWGADVRYRIHNADTNVVDLYLIARNLGDEEARPHTSFLKDLAPLPGRDVAIGVRMAF